MFTERVRGDVTLEGMTSVLIVERVLLHKLDSPGREVTSVEEQTWVFLQQWEHKVTDTTSHFEYNKWRPTLLQQMLIV